VYAHSHHLHCAVTTPIMADAASVSDAAELGEEFRVLIIGPTNIGKSSLINRFIGEEPLLQDGKTENPAAACTAQVGSGTKGTTVVCKSYRAVTSQRLQLDGRVLRLVDTIGSGTTMDGESMGGGLLADLEEMQKLGEKFHLILFCVRATEQAAGLAATMKKLLNYCFLEGRSDQLQENVILVGMQAEKSTMKIGRRYEKFEKDVVASFFSTECFEALRASDGEEPVGAFAYTYFENEERDDCANIHIDELLSKIKATPNWKNFDDLESADLFDYSAPDDEQIDSMFEPLFSSTLTKAQTREQLDRIKASYQRMREELDREREKYKRLQEEDQEVRVTKELLERAVARQRELAGLPAPELRDILKGYGKNLNCRKDAAELRLHLGNSKSPLKKDWIDFILHEEFPELNWLARARRALAEAGKKELPPEWTMTEHDGAHLKRHYKSYHGPNGERTESLPQAWRMHRNSMDMRSPVMPTPAGSDNGRDSRGPRSASKRSSQAVESLDDQEPSEIVRRNKCGRGFTYKCKMPDGSKVTLSRSRCTSDSKARKLMDEYDTKHPTNA